MSRFTDKPASADYVLREGDTGPALEATLKDLDGSVVDLTNATEVRLFIRQQRGDDLVVNTVATIDDAAGGAVSHEFSDGFATTGAGMHELFWRVEFSSGGVESYPRAGTAYLWVPEDFSTEDVAALPPDAEVGVLSATKVGTASDPVGEGHFDHLVGTGVIHATHIDADETLEIPADHGTVIAGPLTGDGSISGDGRLKVI